MSMIQATFTILLCLALALASGRVKVDFYGESLCPDCTGFVAGTLVPMFETGLDKLMDLRYIAYGNVHHVNGTIACQHGPLECKVNRLINCGEYLAKNVTSKWFPFVACVESHAYDRPSLLKYVETCADEAGIGGQAVAACAEGELGAQLEAEAAALTDALEPPHYFVPWVVVNGIPLMDDVEELARYVCVAYSGDRPDACFSLKSRSLFKHSSLNDDVNAN